MKIADGAEYIPSDVTATWKLGDLDPTGFALSYDVYIGTNETAVADANVVNNPSVAEFAGNVGVESFDFAGLASDTEHFWRVDTKLSLTRPPFTSKYAKGAVWSFTTILEVPIVDPNLKGWWKLDGDIVPVLAFDSSGYGNHGTLFGDPAWVPGQVDNGLELDGAGDRVEVATPLGFGGNDSRTIAGWTKANSSSIGNWTNIFGFTSPSGNGLHFDMEIVGDTDGTTQGWFGLHMYGDEYDILPNDLEWHHLAASWDGTNLSVYGDAALVNTVTPTVALNINDRVHMGKRFDNANHYPGIVDDVRIYDKVLTLKEIKIAAGLVAASDPDPANGATDVSKNPTLDWTPGAFAASVNGNVVYYSTDEDAVINRTAPSATLSTPSYALPMTLSLGDVMYWAVDTVNGVETWPGYVWSFTVRNYRMVDDMETYTPWTMPGNNIFEAWRDGEGNCTPGNGNQTGSTVTENIDMAFVLGDLQSMKYEFDNDGLVYSPCSMTQTPRPYL
ncbi:MAG: LamG domain-containing protein, partial [Planctomycetota bacterium]